MYYNILYRTIICYSIFKYTIIYRVHVSERQAPPPREEGDEDAPEVVEVSYSVCSWAYSLVYYSIRQECRSSYDAVSVSKGMLQGCWAYNCLIFGVFLNHATRGRTWLVCDLPWCGCLPSKRRNGVFSTLGVPFGGPHNRECSLWGSLSGSPHFGQLPNDGCR